MSEEKLLAKLDEAESQIQEIMPQPAEPQGERRYLCERCGGTGRVDTQAQYRGVPNHPDGRCGLCDGEGYLGMMEPQPGGASEAPPAVDVGEVVTSLIHATDPSNRLSFDSRVRIIQAHLTAAIASITGDLRCLLCGQPAAEVMHYPDGCECDGARYQARCAQHVVKRPGRPVTIAELVAALASLQSQFANERMDANYNSAVIDGSWPSSMEVLRRKNPHVRELQSQLEAERANNKALTTDRDGWANSLRTSDQQLREACAHIDALRLAVEQARLAMSKLRNDSLQPETRDACNAWLAAHGQGGGA